MLVLAGAALLALHMLHLHEGFVPPPAPRPVQNAGSTSVGLLGASGALLHPAASHAVSADLGKALFEENLYAFGLPWFSWNLFWVLVAVVGPAGLLALTGLIGLVMSPAENSGTRYKSGNYDARRPEGAVMLGSVQAANDPKAGAQSADWR